MSEGVNLTQGKKKKKIKTVINTGELENISKLSSFLGLVNYNARYIPNFANTARLFVKLTRKGQFFIFG